MGTRGLYGFRMNGIDKTSYNHFDSYPDELGVTVANFCEATPVEQMKDIYNRIVMVDEQSKPSPELIQKYRGSCDVSVSTQSPEDWYCLLRGLQGELDWMRSVEGDIHMIDNHEFIKDSLFCEYAYIINLDTEELEFWIGFQHKPDPENRYGQEQDDGYYPCRLYATFPLGENADAVVAQMKKIEENPANATLDDIKAAFDKLEAQADQEPEDAHNGVTCSINLMHSDLTSAGAGDTIDRKE